MLSAEYPCIIPVGTLVWKSISICAPPSNVAKCAMSTAVIVGPEVPANELTAAGSPELAASITFCIMFRHASFRKETNRVIEITLTFTGLSPEAQDDFKDYYRKGQLIITAKAVFNPETEKADVRQYGIRLGFEALKPFFEALGNSASAGDLKTIYTNL